MNLCGLCGHLVPDGLRRARSAADRFTESSTKPGAIRRAARAGTGPGGVKVYLCFDCYASVQPGVSPCPKCGGPIYEVAPNDQSVNAATAPAAGSVRDMASRMREEIRSELTRDFADALADIRNGVRPKPPTG